MKDLKPAIKLLSCGLTRMKSNSMPQVLPTKRVKALASFKVAKNATCCSNVRKMSTLVSIIEINMRVAEDMAMVCIKNGRKRPLKKPNFVRADVIKMTSVLHMKNNANR